MDNFETKVRKVDGGIDTDAWETSIKMRINGMSLEGTARGETREAARRGLGRAMSVLCDELMIIAEDFR